MRLDLPHNDETQVTQAAERLTRRFGFPPPTARLIRLVFGEARDMSALSRDLRSMARALDGKVCGAQVLAPGPGPRDPSLSVRLSASLPYGIICRSFSGDDWRKCLNDVRDRIGLSRDAWRDRKDSPKPEPPKPEKDNRDCALALWRESADPRGTPAATHLRSRGLELGDDVAGSVLGWNARFGAMLAFRNVETDAPQAISRTFIDRQGRKIDRKFLAPAGTAAVKLDADESVLAGLHIGEGIDTCIAARRLCLRPCWTLGSKGAIGTFPVLGGIGALTILAEPDAAAKVDACARRWHAAGREVFIAKSSRGKDLAGIFRGARQ